MNIYNQFLILFALIGTGYISKKYKAISNDMNRDLGNLILFISLPALIITSMSTFTYSKQMMAEIIIMMLASIGLYLFYILMSYIIPKLLRLEGKERDIVQFTTVFANTGFMGFPMAVIFFGAKGLFYMVIVNTFYDVFVWTFGISILGRPQKKEADTQKGFLLSQLKQLVTPCIIAVLIGFILILTSLKLPEVVAGFLNMLGRIATPLAMLFIGSMLADLKFAHILANKTVIKETILKLIILPLIVLGILKLTRLPSLMISILVLATAMPAAASSPILAEKYGNDGYFASKIVFVNTLLSVVTIPLIVFLCKN